jgi:ankyrin repeat protein
MASKQQEFLNSCTMGEVFKVEKMLQSKEADVNKPDTKGFTPLHLTIGAKQVEVVEMLLKFGANVNSVTSKDNYTPLHIAASQGLSTIIPLLVKAGASLEQRDGFGNTPLLVACESPESNSSQCAIVLLQSGAELHALNKTKRNAALLAAKAGKKALYTELKNGGADVTAKDTMGSSAEDYEKSW